jgi:hypothetical protein
VSVGAIKRLVFLIGVGTLFLGVVILNDPVSASGHNCGTSLAPKRFVQTDIRRCQAPLRERRWFGAGVVVVGGLALIVTGPRCLLTDD